MRASLVAECFFDEFEFLSYDSPAACVRTEEGAEVVGFLGFGFEFGIDFVDFETCESIEAELKDGVGLSFVELKTRAQSARSGVFILGIADDLDGFVDAVKEFAIAFEDVDAIFELRELILETFGDDLESEVDEVTNDFEESQTTREIGGVFEVTTRRPRDDARHIDVKTRL